MGLANQKTGWQSAQKEVKEHKSKIPAANKEMKCYLKAQIIREMQNKTMLLIRAVEKLCSHILTQGSIDG